MAGYHVQVVLLVGGQNRQHLGLPGGGAGYHRAVGVQAPVPACLISERPDALPAEGLHECRHRGVDAPAHGLLRRHLLQANPPVHVRLHPSNQGRLQGRHDGHGGVGDFSHQRRHQIVHNGVLLAGEHRSVDVPRRVLRRRLRHLQGLPGLGHPHIELLFYHPGYVLPAVRFHLPEYGLHPFQGGHGVVVHQPLTAQPPNLIDDGGLGSQIDGYELFQLFLIRRSVQRWHSSHHIPVPSADPAGLWRPGRFSRHWRRSPYR